MPSFCKSLVSKKVLCELGVLKTREIKKTYCDKLSIEQIAKLTSEKEAY